MQLLRDTLAAELTRLGKDISKTGSAGGPPAGADNAIFDLSATLVDSNGDPAALPGDAVALRLDWTEQLIGDYDQNGEVNVGDITPLGQQFLSACEYDAPSLHGGFERWPQGSPDDAGTGGPPPANNWRRARIDGDGNGELNLADVTPIAVHWQEALSGYRVYRKGPGESSFGLLPYAGAPPAPPDAAFTLPHLASSPALPVRYSFSDADALAVPGVYQYYCAAYDSTSGGEGRPSSVLSIDTATGLANQAPVALLSVTPDFAGAPAQISFDASGSYDLDGSIVELQWDLDADGTVDYSTTDPAPPELSSGGEIDAIAPGDAPGSGGPPRTLSAQFNQGSAEYKYPKMRVVDDDGAISAWQSAKLGVSGWKRQLVSSSDETAEFDGDELVFSVGELKVNPVTDILTAGGTYRPQSGGNNEITPGAYWAQRAADGKWKRELIADGSEPLLAGFGGEAQFGALGWQANGQPLAIVHMFRQMGLSYDVCAYLGKRSSVGNWTFELLFGGSDGKNGSAGLIVQNVPRDQFVCGAVEGSGKTKMNTYILHYDAGVVTMDDPQIRYESAEQFQGLESIYLDESGGLYICLDDSERLSSINYKVRLGQDNWQLKQFAPDDLSFDTKFLHQMAILGDRAYLLVEARDSVSARYCLCEESGGSIHTIWTGPTNTSVYTLAHFSNEAISVSYAQIFPDSGKQVAKCVRIEGSKQFDETIIRTPDDSAPNPNLMPIPWTLCSDSRDTLYLAIGALGGEFGPATVTLIMSRVDPRL